MTLYDGGKCMVPIHYQSGLGVTNSVKCGTWSAMVYARHLNDVTCEICKRAIIKELQPKLEKTI